MSGNPDEKSQPSTRPFEAASTNRRFALEVSATKRGFTPALFFLIVAVAWTGLTIYLSTINFWNLVPGSVVTAVLYGLAWWFRSQSLGAKIR